MNSPLISQFMGQRKRIFIPQQEIQECSKALQKAFIPFNMENTLEGVYFVLDTPHLYEEACEVLHSLGELNEEYENEITVKISAKELPWDLEPSDEKSIEIGAESAEEAVEKVYMTLKEKYPEMMHESISPQNAKKFLKSYGPYEKNGKTLGPYKIFLVDDFETRNTSAAHEEYSDFGIHSDFPSMIPKNEIWISNRITERERQFYILQALRYQSLIDQGLDQGTAYDKSLSYVKQQREKVDQIKNNQVI